MVGALGLASALAGASAAGLERECLRDPYDTLPAPLRIPAQDERIVGLEGVLVDDPVCEDGLARALLATSRIADRGLTAPFATRVSLTWPADPRTCESGPASGTRLQLFASLRRPRPFGNPGSFDLEASLARRGVTAIAFAKSPRLIVPLSPPASPSVPQRLRRRLEEVLERRFPGEGGGLSPEGSVLRASVLGGRTGLPAEAERALVASGVYHILAVSGLQVAVIGVVVLVLLRFTPLPRRGALLVATLAIGTYAAMVVPSASVGRAVAMACAALCARLLHRETPAMHLVCLAGLAILVWRPSELRDPGFQLTFAATAGLILYATPLSGRLPARWGGSSLLSASIAAQAATWPLVAFWFQRMTAYGLAANLLAVPLGSASVIAGLALLPASCLGSWCERVVGYFCELCMRALLAVASVPVDGTVLSFRTPPVGAGTLLVAGLSLVCLASSRPRARTAGFLLQAIALALPWLCQPGSCIANPGSEGSALVLDLIDVGQGDALLVTFPNGERMLVDGGGFPRSRFDVGERVVVPDLLGRGIRRLGRVLLTHAHEDHGGGLRAVLRDLDVGELLTPDAPEGALRDDLEQLARARGARVVRIRRGYAIDEGDTHIDCLAPFPGFADDPNADSIVLRIAHGKRAVLLTGDIGSSGELRIVDAGLASCDVLKVAHHGSASSSSGALLERARARVAGISVGSRSRFGHPAAAVVARLEASRVSFFTTHRDGALRFSLDATGLYAGSLEPDAVAPWPGPRLLPRTDRPKRSTRGSGSASAER